MDYKHSCVIDARGLYKTLVLVLLETNGTYGDLNLGEFGTAHVAKLSQSSPLMERAKKYISDKLGDGSIVYAGSTDDGRIFYYAESAEGSMTAIILEDPELETAVSFVGPEINDEGILYVVDDGGGKIAFEFSIAEIIPVIQHYTLQEGEQLVDTAPPTMRPYAGAAGYIKPKWDWDAASWTEAATEDEIADWEAEHPAPVSLQSTPTDTQVLNALLGVSGNE